MNRLNKKRKQFIVFSLVVPILLLVGFVLIPACDLFRMSFTDWDGYSPKSNFVALQNYIAMFKNPDLWQSLRNNAVYFIVHLCMIFVELAFAVLLTSKLRAAKFYKTMVFMPYSINGVAIAYAFSYFFSPINGAFNAILTGVHLEGLIRNWLSDPKIVNLYYPLFHCGDTAVIMSSFSWQHYSHFHRTLRKQQEWMEQIHGSFSNTYRFHLLC